ncbi:MAG: hypothetical protein RL722_2439 [Pseudomonadota bacterium]|jgi:hypothetical protein
MNLIPPLAALSVIAALLLDSPAHAADDHGHDHGDAPPATAGPALPRFAATSDVFELVGVLSGRQLTLYVDRADNNAPVTYAQIDLEVAGTRLAVEQHEDVYEAVLASEPGPGVLAITATVTADQEVDLLTAELDLHEHAHPAQADQPPARKAPARWGAAGLGVLAVLALAGRWMAAIRQRRAGAAA